MNTSFERMRHYSDDAMFVTKIENVFKTTLNNRNM